MSRQALPLRGHFSTRSIKEMRADELAILVKCLLCKHKGPEFKSQKPLNEVRHYSVACNLSLDRQRQENLLCWPMRLPKYWVWGNKSSYQNNTKQDGQLLSSDNTRG